MTGWTQAINTLGMCADPTAEQLQAEVPTTQRPTRSIQAKYAGVNKNREVVKVMVFKGACDKAAVIRAATYDLLFNNMKSIVTKTAGTHTHTHTHHKSKRKSEQEDAGTACERNKTRK